MPETFRLGHALLVGVGADLPSTVDDAVGLADILRDPGRCAYPPDQVHLLAGEHATREHILAALDGLARSADPQSTVVVYFSGHGYQVASPTGEFYYLMPFGYDLSRLYQTAISGAEFAQRLRAIPAQKLLVLLDCCHAGGVGDAKAPGLELTKSPLPPEAQALLAEGGGQVLVASSREDELSFAGKPYSAFTLALVEALCGTGVAKEDGYVRVADLALHAREVVPGRTGGRQHPILHFEHADNFVLAYYAGGAVEPKGPPFTRVPAIEPAPGAWTIDQRGQTVHGPQTIITGGEQGVVLSGTTTFQGPAVVGGGEAVDLRGAQDVVYKPAGPVDVVKTVITGDVVGSTVITAREVHYTPLPEIPPPPEPTRPPNVVDFVGRQAELAYFAGKLAATHLAVITGMAGVGKTALAVELVRQIAAPDQLFWHSFHEGEGVDILVWKLAGFLAHHGQEDLWRMLQNTRQAGGQLPPPETLFDYLFQMLRGRAYLLCFDDLHLVDDDPLLGQFAERLPPALQAGDVSLIVASQRVPAFVSVDEFEALPGLGLEDTLEFFAARGMSGPSVQELRARTYSTQALSEMRDLMSAEIIANLHARTEGNPYLLTLAADALQRTSTPARFIIRMFEVGDIDRFLAKEVYDNLEEGERVVMSAVAILLGYTGTRDVIEAVLDGENVRRILRELSRRHLLNASEGEIGREYGMNAVVRYFYCDMLSKRERQTMHRRAGEYYEIQEPDTLRAARHYEQAGEYERAAQLATADVWGLINRGQARALHGLLARFTLRELDPELWVAVNIARGQVQALLGEGQTARDSYEEALSQLAKLGPSPAVQVLKAHACRGMGDLLQFTAPPEALTWLQRGLDALAGADVLLEADLHLKVGSVQIGLGDYAAALTATEEGLSLLPEGPSWLRAGALINLGTIYSSQGDTERGRAYTGEGLEISRQLHLHFKTLVALSDLAIDRHMSGDWEGAAARYEEALALAERLGSVAEQTRIESTLGLLRTNQGDDEAAQAALAHVLELARRHDLKEQLAYTLSNLAELQIRRREWEAAEVSLREAEQLAADMGTKYLLPEIHGRWALVQLARSQPAAALDHAQRAVGLARDLGLDYEEGMGLRVLGQALSASGRHEPARAAFEQSLSILAALDPYEAARTRTQWGLALVPGPDADQGLRLLREAQAAFQELGARRDLETVDEALSKA